ncbi:hypothetical protein AGABI2DRAFT_192295 [Agaricus bisporus var. bisporus H97]|uniref:hypothetical protein n=1 Tax=Agaricus bisporus var. bisporus (strain H97 / ATCC MYA-4626 / FGSC 10389) TaxID=936046 RepID=UPI00029F7A8C|nr:hypothetical protein AGABI2DRAFT_192295 [Agaricus bisporus var. bisporus H97]EKV47019.1 hypothetical protein AGABI2DRAFT_192295 [Agaricus bisporus var. bisporus H97]
MALNDVVRNEHSIKRPRCSHSADEPTLGGNIRLSRSTSKLVQGIGPLRLEYSIAINAEHGVSTEFEIIFKTCRCGNTFPSPGVMASFFNHCRLRSASHPRLMSSDFKFLKMPKCWLMQDLCKG